MPTKMSEYRVPSLSATEDQKAGWLRETIQTGLAWQRGQTAFSSITESKRMIFAGTKDVLPKGQSSIRIPRAKRQIRELVSIVANLKPTASNKSDNEQFYEQAEILNKLDRAWWYNTFADRRFRSSFQAAAVTGTSYVGHAWDPDLRGYGRGDIRTDVYAADEVFLINPPKDHDLQRCYAVVMKSKVPLHLVQKAYPLRAHEIVADYGVAAYTNQGVEYVQSFMSSPLKSLSGKFGDPSTDPSDIWPAVDLYELYILDLSINLTDRDVMMGTPGSSWEYKVPSYGSDLQTGTNGWEGLPLTRKATMQDALLYPLRRRMVATSTIILEDGSSPWWHGNVPLARFSFDDWWSEALGFPLTHDVASIEEETNSMLRDIIDTSHISLDPPLAYDENLVSERLALKLNPRQPSQRVKGNMSMGEMIKPLLPPGYGAQVAGAENVVKYMNEQQDFIIGRSDILSLSKAKQVPGEGTIEKLRELNGPLAEDMTRCMESAQQELGDMRRWLNFQFRTKRQRMQILGDNGLAEEDFDFDPGTMVPSHMEDEDPDKGPSRYSVVERARLTAGHMYYHVVPNSMSRMSSQTQKMNLMLLEKGGFPLDPWSKAELYEVDNFGPPPKGTKDIMTRWIAWRHILRELAAEEQGSVPQQGETRGRKQSGTGSPQAKSKSGGTRSTITTSR
jgi:hypothetical protein